MRGIFGILAAGGLLLGQVGTAEAQFTFSLGNPYSGRGPSISIGQPSSSYYAQPGYAQPGYAQPGYAQPGYSQSGYAQPGYAQPGYNSGYNAYSSVPYRSPSPTTTYSSGYRGYAPTSSHYYNQGFNGSNYVTPSSINRSSTPVYSVPNSYAAPRGGSYYIVR